MKKVVLSVFSLGMAISATVVNANTNKVNSIISVKLEDEKTLVKAEELPETVKKTLAGEAYKGFVAVEAFLVKSGNASHYEVTLIKGDEKQVVKLDAEGKIMQ